MWDKSVAWAKAQTPAGSNYRRNAVHGEEEIKFVLNERFRAKQTEQEEVDQQGAMQYEAWYTLINHCLVQDESGTLLDSDLPDLVADGPAPTAAGSGNGTQPEGQPNTTNVMSFKRLVKFIGSISSLGWHSRPRLQQLPCSPSCHPTSRSWAKRSANAKVRWTESCSFVMTTSWQERLRALKSETADQLLGRTRESGKMCLSFRLVAKMEAIVNDMSSNYDGLATKLSEATVNPEEFDRLLVVYYPCI